MTNLRAIELKPFLPAADFARCKQFYVDVGFTLAPDDGDGVAYFHHGDARFLIQDAHNPALAENLMLHLLVEDVDAWHARIRDADIAGKYGVQVSEVELRPWGMRDFTLHDPSGVLWRIAQTVD